MSRVRFARLFCTVLLVFGTTALSASTITYAVGKCAPGLKGFSTISRALAYLPAPNVIVICPGTYNEQIEITKPVTLKGFSNGASAQAIIAPPSGGLVTNAVDDFGESLAVQVWVNNASGPVNISDLTIDASGNGIQNSGGPNNTFVVGIFYQNSPGIVNQVVTRNQSGDSSGVGIWAEGGSSNPLVTIENSSIHDYDFTGVYAETNFATPELTAVVKGNKITSSNPNALIGILIAAGTTDTVTGNLVADILNPGAVGILATSGSDRQPPTGSIVGNTVVNTGGFGILNQADGVSLTSNHIFGGATGIRVRSSTAAIQSNTITNSPIGMAFDCFGDTNVHSNVITDVGIAFDALPSESIGDILNNTYFNVATIRAGGPSCP